jgi:hypothetical protein
MKINRFYAIIFTLLFLSCSTQPVKVDTPQSGDIDNLEKFFIRSEADSVKAGAVLEKYKIIQHLTHLRRMDSGGKKYYLLEKDDITKMINSVTEGIYLDYILINKHGDIIYTGKNESLFGSNVNSGFETSPLYNCFINRSGVYFGDVSYITPSSSIYSLYISSPVFVEGSFHGVLILQADTKKISDILGTGTEVFSRDGIIRVTSSEELIFSKSSGFKQLDMQVLDNTGVALYRHAGEKLRFSKFVFRDINWILMEKEF